MKKEGGKAWMVVVGLPGDIQDVRIFTSLADAWDWHDEAAERMEKSEDVEIMTVGNPMRVQITLLSEAARR